MKILVVGGGGREHAICWKLAQSPLVEKIYCVPGNAGIASVAECINIPVEDSARLAKFAEDNLISLTVVGPELPLCGGIADVFMAKGLKIFGPSADAARLEGSKIASKSFMLRHGIPTARAEMFEEKDKAIAYVKSNFATSGGLVIKADGLAAGKGVIVASDVEEAITGVESCFGGEFGDAGRKILVEETLKGEEASILALCDGESIIPLASSQDHKRVGVRPPVSITNSLVILR